MPDFDLLMECVPRFAYLHKQAHHHDQKQDVDAHGRNRRQVGRSAHHASCHLCGDSIGVGGSFGPAVVSHLKPAASSVTPTAVRGRFREVDEAKRVSVPIEKLRNPRFWLSA